MIVIIIQAITAITIAIIVTLMMVTIMMMIIDNINNDIIVSGICLQER